jgi:subtilisin family serine protease
MPRPHARVPLALCAALLIAAASMSCSRSLTATTAPARAAQHPAYDQPGTGAAMEDEIVVTLADASEAAAVAAAVGANLVELEPGGRTAEFTPATGQSPAALQAALASDARVVTAEPNGWLETAETRQQSFAFDDGLGSPSAVAEQQAAEAIHLAAAHTVASGAGVVVGILDTGIDPTHPMLRQAYAGGRDFVDGDADPTDLCDGVDNDGDGAVDEGFGHGTHVAGIVHLVAPDARLLIVRVLDADGRGEICDIAAGVRWAVEHGAKVLNMSLGSLKSSDALQSALAEAEERGVVVISSAGNWGADSPQEFPARSSHVAAIAAVDAMASPAAFSSFGDIVALAAPGVAVRSAYPGGGYRLWSGTSMSAPFVAGTVALLAELHPTWTLDQVLQRIAQTAGRMRRDECDFGAGALDAGAALAPDRGARGNLAPPGELVRQR